MERFDYFSGHLMNQTNKRKRLRSILSWVFWVLLIQFLLINITSIFYAYKLTHFYKPLEKNSKQPAKNLLTKTWKLFTGPKYRKAEQGAWPHYPYESVDLRTRDNKRIRAWFMPADSSKGTVVLFHGLGGNKSMMIDEAYAFRDLGYNTMLVDLRAHGQSEGETTTLGVRESEEVKLAFNFLVAKKEKNIILYGLSLGAVVIAKSIHDHGIKPSKIILEAPFASLQDHLRARARVLGFPSEPFATLVTFWSGVERGFNGFNHSTGNYAEKINCPVLLQSGALDKWVLPAEINSVFSHIATTNKKMVIYENAEHESFLGSDPEKWIREIRNFLSD
jgi:alpha-beta hydrolase superfamily lysophospholipase